MPFSDDIRYGKPLSNQQKSPHKRVFCGGAKFRETFFLLLTRCAILSGGFKLLVLPSPNSSIAIQRLSDEAFGR